MNVNLTQLELTLIDPYVYTAVRSLEHRGIINPSKQQIADLTRLSKPTIQLSTLRLRNAGWLTMDTYGKGIRYTLHNESMPYTTDDFITDSSSSAKEKGLLLFLTMHTLNSHGLYGTTKDLIPYTRKTFSKDIGIPVATLNKHFISLYDKGLFNVEYLVFKHEYGNEVQDNILEILQI